MFLLNFDLKESLTLDGHCCNMTSAHRLCYKKHNAPGCAALCAARDGGG